MFRLVGYIEGSALRNNASELEVSHVGSPNVSRNLCLFVENTELDAYSLQIQNVQAMKEISVS